MSIRPLRIIDATIEAIHGLATTWAIEAARRTAHNELDYMLRKTVERPPAHAGGTGESIWRFLDSCRRVVENRLVKEAEGYSAFRWLWYLRRLPRLVFEGQLATTYAYDATLAEVLSGLGGHGQDASDQLAVTYPINDAVVWRVLKFCGGVRYLSNIHSLMRMAAKDVRFSFRNDETLPTPTPSAEQLEAIGLYDERNTASFNPLQVLHRTGSAVASEVEGDDHGNWILGIFLFREPTWMPAVLGILSGRDSGIEVLANFAPYPISVGELGNLNSRPGLSGRAWWQPEAASILALLGFGSSILRNLETAHVMIPRLGYVLLSNEVFDQVVEMSLSSASRLVRNLVPGVALPGTAAGLLSALERLSGSAWPLKPGPVVRRIRGGVCLDLYSATGLLNAMFEFPRSDGNPANARARHFEDVVQRIVDSSPWCPPEPLLALRRRTLRFQGNAITDLDSVGTRGDTLLLISCKSVIYSSEYDAGEFSATRNARSTVEQGVTRWAEVLRFLRQHPVGDNYDLSRYTNVIGIVCTPFPVYVIPGPTTEWVLPGLRAACSLTELATWLNQFA